VVPFGCSQVSDTKSWVAQSKMRVANVLAIWLFSCSISEVLQEPIGQWQNVNGTGLNMLEAFYKDPHRYAYLFQSFVFTTRFLQQNAAASTSKAVFLLTERSVLTDRCVFVETGKDQGYLNALEVAAYEAWYHGVVAALPNVVPDAFVYLRADPVVCYDRLKARCSHKLIL
jgi:deoxyadenosine/deoxycytidine kinase